MRKREKEFQEKEELCEIWRKKYVERQEHYEKVEESLVRYEK